MTSARSPLRPIVEPRRVLPEREACDVAVVGGGMAGVAAALAAAREGARVCLVERACALGGLATLGMVTEYLPLCDGRGRQVIGGLAERLLHLSIRDGTDRVPPAWQAPADASERAKRRYRVHFNPAWFMIALEREILRAGVRLRYDTRACGVHRRGRRLAALIVEDKGGRAALRCRAVVDASGDADVAAQCGEPTVSLRTNVACGWFDHLDQGAVQRCRLSRSYDASGQGLPAGERGFAGEDPDDVAAQVVASRRWILAAFDARTLGRPAARDGLLRIPVLPTFRMTRRLAGEAVLRASDDGAARPDTVTLIGDWRRAGPVYPVTYRMLVAPGTTNLLVAGRCLSAEGEAWDAARSMPACAATGEAAGIAAALAAGRARPNLHRLGWKTLRSRLVSAGLRLQTGEGP